MSRLHTNFVEVKVHTAKCDSCEKHNKGTLYRCAECGQQVCSFCWTVLSGDKTHVYGSGSYDVPQSTANRLDEGGVGDADDDQADEMGVTRQARIRRTIVISDDEDDDLPMSKPAPTRHAVVNDDQGLSRQTRHPDYSRVPHQQAPYPTPLHAQPASYHNQPRDYLDQQVARNQYAFANIQPAQRQAPDPTHSLNAHQRATQLALRQTQHASYPPRSGVNVHQQAARGQDLDHQNRMPNQASFSRPNAVPLDPRSAQASISPQNAQVAPNMDAVAAYNRHVLLINQQAQAQARASAMSMEARNRQPMGVYGFLPPNTHRDQVAAHHRQLLASNQQSASTRTSMEQEMRARAQQKASLSRKQATRPHPGPPQTSYPYQGPTKSYPLPPQVSLSQQHAALPASRQVLNPTAIESHPKRPSGNAQVREHSPGILAAADALLACARNDQESDAYDRPDQDTTAVSQPVSAASQLSKASSGSPTSRASSKTLTGGPGAAEIYHVNGPVMSSRLPSAGADVANARLEKHRDRQAGVHISSGTHKPVSDPSISPRGHPSYSHARLQPHSGSALVDSSAGQSPSHSVSNHAATYLSQWNSGRAAHSLSPSPQLYTTCSSSPALHAGSPLSVQDINVGASDSKGAAEANTKAPRDPDCALGGPSDIDIVIMSPDVEGNDSRRSETLALENMPRKPTEDGGSEETRFPGPIPSLLAEGRAKKHQRDETKAERKISKEHKASGDVDVVDARGRNGKDRRSGQIDKNGGDIEIASWRKLDSSGTPKNHGEANAVAKGLEHVGSYKKGVAYVKKPASKGRKVRKSARHIG